MKRSVLTGFFFVIAMASQAQDGVLFKVVTLSFGVSVDGRGIGVGDDITSGAKQIIIPKGGYLVTADGFAYELTTSIAVPEVNTFIKSSQLIPTGARPGEWDDVTLDTPLGVDGYTSIWGDSLFIIWDEREEKNRQKGNEYVVSFDDARTQVSMDEKTIDHNWIVININPYLETMSPIGIEIRSKRTRHIAGMVVKRDTKVNEKLKSDLERLGDNHDLAILCAVFDLNKARHDRNFVIYKIHTQMLMRQYAPAGVMMTYIGRFNRDLDLR